MGCGRGGTCFDRPAALPIAPRRLPAALPRVQRQPEEENRSLLEHHEAHRWRNPMVLLALRVERWGAV